MSSNKWRNEDLSRPGLKMPKLPTLGRDPEYGELSSPPARHPPEALKPSLCLLYLFWKDKMCTNILQSLGGAGGCVWEAPFLTWPRQLWSSPDAVSGRCPQEGRGSAVRVVLFSLCDVWWTAVALLHLSLPGCCPRCAAIYFPVPLRGSCAVIIFCCRKHCCN